MSVGSTQDGSAAGSGADLTRKNRREACGFCILRLPAVFCLRKFAALYSGGLIVMV